MVRVDPAIYKWGNNPIWAKANKTTGAFSMASGLIGAGCGCIKDCTDEGSFLNKFIGFIQSVAYGFRNYFQYSLYSRKEDDDLGDDIHKRPLAANIGEIACFIEKKVNPFLLPITRLLGERISESYNSIAHLANALWWRTRFCSNKINWGILNQTFINNAKTLFDKNLRYRSGATEDMEKALTPILGLIGIGTMSLFNPIKSFSELFGLKNKLINFMASVGICTQHLAYLFRFSLPQLWEAQEKNKTNNKILAATGLTANTLNIALPLVEFLPSDNSFLGTFHKLYQELATGFTAAFFSTRRHFMGKEWLEKNKENLSNACS